MGGQQLSPNEWHIMRALWARTEATVNEVVEQVAESTSWHPKTVRTMLNRLAKKGFVTCGKRDGTYVYSPRFTEKQCVDQASDQFINRVFDGALAPMVEHFVRERRLTPEQRAELKRILDEESMDE